MIKNFLLSADQGIDKKKLILVGVISFTLLYLDFNFIKAQFSFIKESGPKIAQLKNNIANFNRDLARMKESGGQNNTVKQKARMRIKKIIKEEQIPLLLQFISDIANKSNVNILQIRPIKEAKPKLDKPGSVQTKFTPVSIALSLSGGYHNVGKFINELENSEDFISVEEVRISPGSVDTLRQDVSIFLKTYVGK